jgi:chromosome segregation protein
MSALSRIRERLQSEADDLFAIRRSGSKLFYLAADRRDAADKAWRASIVTREALQQLTAAVAAAREHLGALTTAHAQSGSQLARWQRTVGVRSQLARPESIHQDLAGFADLPPVSPQLRADWHAALAGDFVLRDEIAALDATGAAEAAAMAIDEAL